MTAGGDEERDLIARNPVGINTRKRKLKTSRTRPVYLDSAEQIAALLDAATELDATPQARTAGRRALIATLVFAGLRIGEATALRWRDIDLAGGRITVGASKTEAGIREVDIQRRKARICGPSGGWARRVSNLRPLACEASALPLSYAPGERASVYVTILKLLRMSDEAL